MLAKVKSTRVESAYDRLKDEILRGILPPGYQAPEPDIAQRLGMSRTPVREALIRLEAERLVDLIPRRGARVVAISQKDFREIFEILAVLESLAADAAARLDSLSDPLQDIHRVMEDGETALRANDIAAWAHLDDTFHRLIAGLSGNDRLNTEICGLLDQVFRANAVLLRLNKAPAARETTHCKIVEAIAAGEAQQAADLAKAHRLSGLKTMNVLLANSGLSQV
ncbi:GntR family transcriptional regulator [Roseibium sp.]|uniref:GntR family transcriptional regulator n=1 Tax=Roseibium sp. TaxID=1936156 RepID=UPI003B507B9E